MTALLAVSHVDLGITPLEASAWGVPTVALRAGGYLGTIVDGINGVFVEAPTVEAVAGRAELLAKTETAPRCRRTPSGSPRRSSDGGSVACWSRCRRSPVPPRQPPVKGH